jgi:hypothetical protein
MKYFISLLSLALIGIVSCQSGDETIGLNIAPDTQLNVQLIDTITVQASTILSDTITTSASTALLLGRMANPRTGSVRASAYFQVINAGAFALSGNASRIRYDSIVLQLRYARAYGDTLTRQRVSVHTLKNLPADNKIYYNQDSLPYNAVPLASRTFVARPITDTTVNLRLPDSLGRRIFDLIRTEQLTSNESLLELLPGLVLLPGPTDNAAIVTFAATRSQIQLFYHDVDLDITRYRLTFGVRAGVTQFNNIRHDRRGTALNRLTEPRRQEIDSRLTNDESYVQLGGGLRTVLRIPGLDNLRAIDGFASINRVDLIVGTTRQTLRDNLPPPAQLQLQLLNANNEVINDPAQSSFLFDYSNQPLVANYQFDPFAPTLVDNYTFSLTRYVSNLAKGLVSNRALLLTIPQAIPDNGLSLNRLVIGGPRNPDRDNRIRLRVFYTTR